MPDRATSVEPSDVEADAESRGRAWCGELRCPHGVECRLREHLLAVRRRAAGEQYAEEATEIEDGAVHASARSHSQLERRCLELAAVECPHVRFGQTLLQRRD